MKLRNVFIFGLVVILVLAFTSTGVAKAKITIKIADVLATNHPVNVSLNDKFVKIVNEKTKGKIEIQVFPNSQLGNERDLAEGIQLGTIDVAVVGTAGLRTYDERMMLFYLPYLFTSRENAYSLLDGDVGEYLFKLIEAKGVKGLGWFENGYRHITNSKRPINKPEDLKGIKIRVPEIPVHVYTFKTIGANPTPMAFGELFTSLQQGTVDAQENPLVIIDTSKFYEVQKYLSLTGHVWDPFAMLISQKIWGKLTDEQKLILQEAAKETISYEREICIEKDKILIQKLKDKGMVVNEVDLNAFHNAVKPVYDKYAEQFGIDLINKIKK